MKTSVRAAVWISYAMDNCDGVYHGTDDASAASVEADGLNKQKWLTAGGGAGVDPKGFSVTTNKEVAEAWAKVRAAKRGGSPVVLAAPARSLPLRKGDLDDLADPEEFYIRPTDFAKVGPGAFTPAP